MELEEELRRAARAKEIIGNEIFTDAVKVLEEALLLGIRQSAFKDDGLREKLCHRYALLHDLVGQIQTVIETGQMAAEQIKQRTILQKAKEFFNG